MSVFSVPGTVLGAGNPAVDKTHKNLCYQGVDIPMDGGQWLFLVFSRNFLNGYVIPFHNKKIIYIFKFLLFLL